jgi:hypothetical protein
MLRQLADLTLEVDGVYAEDYQLEFIEDYLDSYEIRVSAYNKISSLSTEIVEQVRLIKQKRDPNFEDFYATCKRDLIDLLRYSAAALLFDDLERLRTNMLIWFQSIARAWNFEEDNNDTYDALLEAVAQFFSEEELKYVLPVFELNRVVLV